MAGYFDWLVSTVCYGPDEDSSEHYHKLLGHLYDKDFYWILPMDENRYEDGLALREVYLDGRDYVEGMSYREPSCSILEMMIALAVRMENSIMEDEEEGDRTRLWFWYMVDCLGLSEFYDENYSEGQVEDILDTFLERMYRPDGYGGLFYVERDDIDMTKVEIWYQMCYFLDSYLGV